jgi:predicted nucleic acid-binding protein
VRSVLDTCILVDYLRGVEAARVEIARYERPAVSVVTWMEVLAGTAGEEEGRTVRAFLGRFDVLPLTPAVAERAVAIRRARRVRLPDAVIQATADDLGALLVTRNERDFPPDDPGVRVPYRL